MNSLGVTAPSRHGRLGPRSSLSPVWSPPCPPPLSPARRGARRPPPVEDAPGGSPLSTRLRPALVAGPARPPLPPGRRAVGRRVPPSADPGISGPQGPRGGQVGKSPRMPLPYSRPDRPSQLGTCQTTGPARPRPHVPQAVWFDRRPRSQSDPGFLEPRPPGWPDDPVPQVPRPLGDPGLGTAWIASATVRPGDLGPSQPRRPRRPVRPGAVVSRSP
jgi:hypothetical protein